MKRIVKISRELNSSVSQLGGKAHALKQLMGKDFLIPASYCITTSAYREFINQNGLEARISFELSRKSLSDCRWEEFWDISLRIRNLFLRQKLPAAMAKELEEVYRHEFCDMPLAIRSSSTVEDSSNRSFAGLHESHIGICSLGDLEEKLKLVWASLWSDASLSYRSELGLSLESSSMAVLLQPVICGEVSGICFTCNPLNKSQAVIEAVYGLNQGLVDGKIEPDRWVIERQNFGLIKFTEAKRGNKFQTTPDGITMLKVSATEAAEPPLNDKSVQSVLQMAMRAENNYQMPQDVEWTIENGDLFLLQSRPITTTRKPDPKTDRREWDISLKRSFANLCDLRQQIAPILEKMASEAAEILRIDLRTLNNDSLVEHFHLATQRLQHWTDVYWEIFIPYGHGMRFFGQIYNETMLPEDPYEFVTLLQASENMATRRNREFNELARMIQRDGKAMRLIAEMKSAGLSAAIVAQMQLLVDKYAMSPRIMAMETGDSHSGKFLRFLAKVPLSQQKQPVKRDDAIARQLEEKFLMQFPAGEKRRQAAEILELGRHSFILRDDDNVYLNRFKNAVEVCTDELRRRVSAFIPDNITDFSDAELAEKLLNSDFTPSAKITRTESCQKNTTTRLVRKRQLLGQPAGPGFASGLARVLRSHEDIFEVKRGEIIVCDAIGPEMTLVVPLAAGIIERRGGMLIHGAIIAREYGIPCITGIPSATEDINNGDQISVDGYLGIVTVRTLNAN
ncbi:MAG: hypothetical protein CVV41_11895 [Candidatus Riflebacteria bacterium HGW-Riflebacteria-1]|nr:MAG: hypothetical protein CVV41_11895 [Candidatus Riflebacteria bacterium HGW-Riflebacteria-1]